MMRALTLPLATFLIAVVAALATHRYVQQPALLPKTNALDVAGDIAGLVVGLLLAGAALMLWVRTRLSSAANAASEPINRLIPALAAQATDRGGVIRIPPLPTSAAREWIELFAALESACHRADAALMGERRAADALESTNRALSAEIDSRESYLDKQTKRLQEAMTATWQAAEAKTRVLTNTHAAQRHNRHHRAAAAFAAAQ